MQGFKYLFNQHRNFDTTVMPLSNLMELRNQRASACARPPVQGRRERAALRAQIQRGVCGASAGRSLVSSAAADSLSDVERPGTGEVSAPLRVSLAHKRASGSFLLRFGLDLRLYFTDQDDNFHIYTPPSTTFFHYWRTNGKHNVAKTF